MTRPGPSEAELALEACLASGMPADEAARVAERTQYGALSERDQRRLEQRFAKLIELAKSWQAFSGEVPAGQTGMAFLSAAAMVLRHATGPAGEGAFMELARAAWRMLEESSGG